MTNRLGKAIQIRSIFRSDDHWCRQIMLNFRNKVKSGLLDEFNFTSKIDIYIDIDTTLKIEIDGDKAFY